MVATYHGSHSNDQEMEKKRAQLAAESKILAEAEEKKKLVEKEAA